MNVQGSNDVLTMALKKPEKTGRVRGVGGFITPTAYFHTPTLSMRELQFKQQQWMLQQQKVWDEEKRELQERLAIAEKELKDLKEPNNRGKTSLSNAPTQNQQSNTQRVVDREIKDPNETNNKGKRSLSSPPTGNPKVHTQRVTTDPLQQEILVTFINIFQFMVYF